MKVTDNKMQEHLHDAVIENIKFLMGAGYSFEMACAHIERKPSSVEKLFERRGLPNPANKQEAC